MDKIIEGNRLIARFMGWEILPDGTVSNKEWADKYSPADNFIPEILSYHSSWDWLMQVVKKIKSMDRDWPISTEPVLELFICSDIEIVWQKIVEFIKCYNTQKK